MNYGGVLLGQKEVREVCNNASEDRDFSWHAHKTFVKCNESLDAYYLDRILDLFRIVSSNFGSSYLNRSGRWHCWKPVDEKSTFCSWVRAST